MTGAQFARFFRGEYATLMCCRSGARKLAVRKQGFEEQRNRKPLKGVELSQFWSRTTQELSFRISAAIEEALNHQTRVICVRACRHVRYFR